MANSIENIVSKEAQKQLDDLHKGIIATHDELIKLSKIQIDFNGGSSPKNPAQVNKIIADFDKIEKANNRVTNLMVKNAERQRLAELKLSQDREKAFAKVETQLNKEQAKLEISSNAYNRLNAVMNTLQNTYKSLAIRKELGSQLTDKEEKKLGILQGRISRLDGALKAVDSNMGRYSRNVGNYASGFSPLSNSIGQIARELPNFGQSVQIGIMSITNNIGALQDAIKGIVAQNKILASEGKATQSVLKQIGSQILSFNVLLFVGIAFLNAYGKEIGEWAKSLFGASGALDELNGRQKEFNNSRITGQKDAQSEIIELKKYLAVVKNRNLSDEERNIALKQLRQQYPFYFKSLTDEQILTGKTTEAQERLNLALEKRKQVEKGTELNVQNKQKLIDLNVELDLQNKIVKQTEAQLKTLLKRQSIRPEALAEIGDRQNKAREKAIQLEKDIQKYTEATIKNDSIIIRLKGETIGLEYQENKLREKKIKLKREDLSLVGEELKAQGSTSILDKLEAERSKMIELQRAMSTNNVEWKIYQRNIDAVTKMIDALTNKETGLVESGNKTAASLKKRGEDAEKLAEAMRKLNWQTSQFLSNQGSSFLEDMGLGSINFFTKIQENGLTMFQELSLGADDLGGKIDNLGKKISIAFIGMAEVAQEAFAFINQQSELRFARELERLEAQKTLSIKYARGGTEAKEEIERQYEERRRRIEQQKAQQQKDSAIFNIVIDTAQAIVGALAEQNYGGAILFAALGAAQLAIVSSQQVPAYEHGTDNHQGGAMLINDGKGSDFQETVVTPDGKAKQFKGRNVLTSAPKGTKVFTAKQWNKELNDMLLDAGINHNLNLGSMLESPKGISANEMDNILGSYFKNIQTNHTTIDKEGINDYIIKGGQKTKRVSDRTSFKGYSV